MVYGPEWVSLLLTKFGLCYDARNMFVAVSFSMFIQRV